MKPSELLNQHREAIRQVVAAHRASNPRVFGSIVHGEDTETSDLDLLIDPSEGMSLFDMGAIIAELNELLGVEVDVVSARDAQGDAPACAARRSADMMSPRLRLRDYLQHMVSAIDQIRIYTLGMEHDAFMRDAKTQVAVIRNLQVIGEAAHNIRRHHPDFVAASPDVAWRSAYGMRNAVTHGYFSIDLE
jgi:uncharacterized protein with HEPN domain/predicted nucleotidyltransferase